MGDALTELAARFAERLLAAADGKRRVYRADYTAAFLAAEPSLTTSPERRRRLSEAIDELAAAGLCRRSRALETDDAPPLPKFLVVDAVEANDPVAPEAAAYPWRPELAWAPRLSLRRSEFDALKRVQLFLKDRAARALIVPVGERSLELFDDEKRLDALLRGQRLFGRGRLTLELLKARAHAPPFVYQRLGAGAVALVVENVATFHSILSQLPRESPVGVVVFGGGGAFAASVGYFAELPGPPIREIRYFGDLDKKGLEVPIAASATAEIAGFPSVRPAVGLRSLLFEHGRRAAHASVDAATAKRLATWLPAPVRSDAVAVLSASQRIAQEAVGSELLSRNHVWHTWAGLGPPGCVRMHDQLDHVGTTQGSSSARVETSKPVDFHDVRAFALDDPLLDWLSLHGGRCGFAPDTSRPGYSPREDLSVFLRDKADHFRRRVGELLARRIEGARDAENDSRFTADAMSARAPIILNASLSDAAVGVRGRVDVLVRSDKLAEWFPELLSQRDARAAAVGVGFKEFHYRVVSIYFGVLRLTASGEMPTNGSGLATSVVTALQIEALNRVQGIDVDVGYVLGRTWSQGDLRGEGCLERLGIVRLEKDVPQRECGLRELAARAVRWREKLLSDGERWTPLPSPTVEELYPNMKNNFDAPWRSAKREIAAKLRELTLLPSVTTKQRRAAHRHNLTSLASDGLSAATLGVSGAKNAALIDGFLAVHRSTAAGLSFAASTSSASSSWRTSAPLELFVDFETVSDLDDDFSRLPSAGGAAMIFQIGCGHFQAGEWVFQQWTVDSLSPADEARVVEKWLRHMKSVMDAAGASWSDVRLCHWSPAEPRAFEQEYARARRAGHSTTGDSAWPETLPWFDVHSVMRDGVFVRRAFSTKLKDVARALHARGLVSLEWEDDSFDGTSAMAAAWAVHHESTESGAVAFSEHELIRKVARYNAADCRAVAEILRVLREHR